MGLRAKKRAALLVLGGLAVWPAIHFDLYQRYRIDPWKFCGWAMYARPRAAHELQIYREVQGVERQVVQLPLAIGRVLEDSMSRRSALGRWHRPDDLGAALIAAWPEATRFRLVIKRIDLDCSTGMLDDETYDEYIYRP